MYPHQLKRFPNINGDFLFHELEASAFGRNSPWRLSPTLSKSTTLALIKFLLTSTLRISFVVSCVLDHFFNEIEMTGVISGYCHKFGLMVCYICAHWQLQYKFTILRMQKTYTRSPDAISTNLGFLWMAQRKMKYWFKKHVDISSLHNCIYILGTFFSKATHFHLVAIISSRASWMKQYWLRSHHLATSRSVPKV